MIDEKLILYEGTWESLKIASQNYVNKISDLIVKKFLEILFFVNK